MAQRRTRHALPALLSPLEVVQPHACPVCGYEVRSTVWIAPTDASPVRARQIGGTEAVPRRGTLSRFDRSGVSMDYPGVARDGEDILFPAHEGALGAGRVIDRYGDPDQMAEFAAEYLKRSGAIMPEGGLPRRVSEMMPALHLLINAAELALKADLVRAEKDSGGHVLTTLYGRLDGAHRDEVERRFAFAGPNADLVVLRVAQHVATDAAGAEREAFRRFVAGRPPAYRTEWMYGGGRLLFYRVPELPPDGETEIDGLACRVWSCGHLGLHARDLYRLADVLEDGRGVFDPSPYGSVST